MKLSVKALFRSFEESPSGWQDTVLSVSLVVSGVPVIIVGLFAPRTIKLVVPAWVWFPYLELCWSRGDLNFRLQHLLQLLGWPKCDLALAPDFDNFAGL
jgi:hypothetical protein